MGGAPGSLGLASDLVAQDRARQDGRLAARQADQARILKALAAEMATEQRGGRGQNLDAFVRVLRNGDRRRRFLVPRQAFQRRAVARLAAAGLAVGACEAIARFCGCCASTVRQNAQGCG